MKALAVSAFCLFVFAAPAVAFAPGGPHPVPPGPHPAPHPPGPNHGRHGGRNVFFDPFGPEAITTIPAPEAAAAEAPVVELPPPPLCGFPPPRPHRPTGPHIIYIGRQPTIEGPTVIYGTDD